MFMSKDEQGKKYKGTILIYGKEHVQNIQFLIPENNTKNCPIESIDTSMLQIKRRQGEKPTTLCMKCL